MTMAEGDRLRFRPARPADHGACAEIFLAARMRANPDIPADRFAIEDFNLSTDDLEILVAERGGLVVGFVGLDRAQRELSHLFVSPLEQGRGVGALLLAEAGRILGPGAHLLCDAQNTSVREFYRAQGWVEARESWGFIEFVRPDAGRLPFPASLGSPLFAV